MTEPGTEGRVLFLALGAVAMLLVTLAARRAPKSVTGALPAPTRGHAWMGALLVTLAGAPLLDVAPWAHANVTFGDAITHTRVASEIATHGVASGWIESYLGGFPFATHYPPLGWFTVATLIALGLTPLFATHLLGWFATFATPLVLYGSLLRCRIAPAPALAAACFVAWTAPATAFTGGYEAFLRLGLLSQVLALPLLVGAASFVAHARSHWPAVVLWSLGVLAHPQLTIAAAIACMGASLASGSREVVARCARALVGAVGVALATYGPGLLALDVPFGWPSGLGWRHLGLEPRHVIAWLRDGDLLDVQRPAVLTDVALLGVMGLCLQLRQRPARAIACATALVLGMALCGHALDATPMRPLLSAIQPLRALALVPVVLAISLAAALQLAAPHLRQALGQRRATEHAPLALSLACALALTPALAERSRYATSVGDALTARATAPCGAHTPAGYDDSALRTALEELRGGRLWFAEHDTAAVYCMNDGTLQLSSAVPLATTLAVGAHIGVQAELFALLDPAHSDATLHATAIGARYIVTSDAAPRDWSPVAAHGLEIWENPTQPGLVGVGCVRERWTGDDHALRRAIADAIETGEAPRRFLHPTELVAWREAAGPLRRARIDDACSIAGASVRELRSEPGTLEAEISSLAPVDVVLRVTSYRGWHVTVDGHEVPLERVAPGFWAVRVDPGTHHIEANIADTPGRSTAVVIGALLFAAAGVQRRRDARLRKPRLV